jgi:murein DD-endopeptidase MepM/ murein hydrolase activator NlpD
VDLHKSLTHVKNAILANKKTAITLGSSALLLIACLGFFTFFSMDAKPETEDRVQLSAFPVIVPTMGWGFALDTLQLARTEIQSGQSLSDILDTYGLSGNERQLMIERAGEVFDLLGMRAGKPLIALSRDSSQVVDYLVYEPSVYEYIVLELTGDQKVYRTERPVMTQVETAAGIIDASLWQAMVDRGYSYELTDKMEDALQWSIDFHHLQPNEAFRLVYERKYIEGEPIGVGQVLAAEYTTADTTFHSIFFEGTMETTGYYDLNAKPMNAGFLRAPVKYSRISSYYNLNRLHPVLKYRRPHYGTDYAAPYGTPILAVGNGVVTKAAYTRGNGNYVKIRHSDAYETQYLHMQKFAAGIRPGVHVRQGQVIGYVGSTGLATGPHVCFRFWKNGRQVNHLKLRFPPAKPLVDSLQPAFFALRDQYVPLLSAAVPKALPKEEVASTDNP